MTRTERNHLRLHHKCTEDRDVHASKNVKLFGSTKRTECLEQASAEASITTQSIVSQLVMQIEPLKRKQEATTF